MLGVVYEIALGQTSRHATNFLDTLTVVGSLLVRLKELISEFLKPLHLNLICTQILVVKLQFRTIFKESLLFNLDGQLLLKIEIRFALSSLLFRLLLPLLLFERLRDYVSNKVEMVVYCVLDVIDSFHQDELIFDDLVLSDPI